MRYFLADILQFQSHRGLAQAAGCKEPNQLPGVIPVNPV